MASASVTLLPGVPLQVATVGLAALEVAAFASISIDRTVSGGLNAVATSVAVHLSWEATIDGVNWYEVASCVVGGASGVTSPAASSSLGVSATAAEQQARINAVQPSAVGASVVLSYDVGASAVP